MRHTLCRHKTRTDLRYGLALPPPPPPCLLSARKFMSSQQVSVGQYRARSPSHPCALHFLLRALWLILHHVDCMQPPARPPILFPANLLTLSRAALSCRVARSPRSISPAVSLSMSPPTSAACRGANFGPSFLRHAVKIAPTCLVCCVFHRQIRSAAIIFTSSYSP